MAEVRIPICLVCGSDLPRGGGQCAACARVAARRVSAHGVPADTPLPAAPPLPSRPSPTSLPALLTVRPDAVGPRDDVRAPRRMALALAVPVLAVLAIGWSMRGPADLRDRLARARAAEAAAAAAAQGRTVGVGADPTGTTVSAVSNDPGQPYATGTGRPPTATVPEVAAGPGPDVVVDTTLPVAVDPLLVPPTEPTGPTVPGTDERGRRSPDRPAPAGADVTSDGGWAEPAAPEFGSAGPWPAPDDAPVTVTTDAPAPSVPPITVRPTATTTPTTTPATTPAPTTTRPSVTTTTTTTTTEPPPPPPPTTDPPPTTTDAPPPDPVPTDPAP